MSKALKELYDVIEDIDGELHTARLFEVAAATISTEDLAYWIEVMRAAAAELAEKQTPTPAAPYQGEEVNTEFRQQIQNGWIYG